MQHYLLLIRANSYAENSMVTKFCYLALLGPVIMPNRVDPQPHGELSFGGGQCGYHTTLRTQAAYACIYKPGRLRQML